MGTRFVILALGALGISASACDGRVESGDAGGGDGTTTIALGGVCNTGVHDHGDEFEACMEASCCPEVIACADDDYCRRCYTVDSGNEEECDTEPPWTELRTAVSECRAAHCPWAFCRDPWLGFGVGYKNVNDEYDFACNVCANSSCCGTMEACPDPGAPECDECMRDPQSPACTALGSFSSAVIAFHECMAASCAGCTL